MQRTLLVVAGVVVIVPAADERRLLVVVPTVFAFEAAEVVKAAGHPLDGRWTTAVEALRWDPLIHVPRVTMWRDLLLMN